MKNTGEEATEATPHESDGDVTGAVPTRHRFSLGVMLIAALAVAGVWVMINPGTDRSVSTAVDTMAAGETVTQRDDDAGDDRDGSLSTAVVVALEHFGVHGTFRGVELPETVVAAVGDTAAVVRTATAQGCQFVLIDTMTVTVSDVLQDPTKVMCSPEHVAADQQRLDWFDTLASNQ